MRKLLQIFTSTYIFLMGSALTSQTFDEVSILTRSGIAYFEQKKFNEAKIEFSRALEIDSTDPQAATYFAKSFSTLVKADLLIENTRRWIALEKYDSAVKSLDFAELTFPYHPAIPELRKLIREKKDTNAKIILQKLAPNKKTQYEALMKKADTSFESQKFAESMHHYTQALKIVPLSVEAKLGYDESEKMLNAEGNTAKISQLFQKAEKLEKERRYAQSISVYDQILRLEPANEIANSKRNSLLDLMQQQMTDAERKNLAQEYLQSGDESMRKTDFLKALESYKIGKSIYEPLTDWDSLIKKAERALKNQEEQQFSERLKEMEKRYQSAILNLMIDNYPGAIEDLEVVIDIARQFKQTETEKQAMDLLHKAKESMLRQDEEFASRESPYYNFIQSLSSLGLNSYQKLDCQSAIKHFSGIIEVFPKNRISNQHILSCQLILNPASKDQVIADLITRILSLKDSNAFEAKRLFELLKFIDPKNPRLAEIERELRERTAILKGSVKPEAYSQAQYDRALRLSQTDPEAAMTLLKKLLEENISFVKARTLLARIEGRLNRDRWAESAIPITENALKFYTDGLVYYNTNQIDKARFAFNHAIQLAPNFERAKVALKKCEAYSKAK